MHLDRRQLLATSAAGFASLSLGSGAAFARDLPTGNPKSLGFDPDRLQRIHTALQRRVEAGEAPGYVTAIMRQGKILHFDTVGYRNIEAKTPMSRDTIFRIMSMTKPIVSVATMMLVEEGRIRLTDNISKFIPAFAKQQVYVSGEGDSMVLAPAKRQIQIRNLLTHTSGYTYGVFTNTPVDKLQLQKKLYTRSFPSLAAFADAAAAFPLMFEPGTMWSYGISTDILGAVIEVVTGQKLGDFLQERILGPLGMVDTAFTVPPEKRNRFTNCYVTTPEGLKVYPDQEGDFIDPKQPHSGGGGLTSTADDYLRFATMLLNEGELEGRRYLGPQTVKLMRTNMLPANAVAQRNGEFGLGFGIDMNTGARAMYAGEGSYQWSGYNRTHFWVDPTYKIVGLIMTQMQPFNNTVEEDMRALTYQAFLG